VWTCTLAIICWIIFRPGRGVEVVRVAEVAPNSRPVEAKEPPLPVGGRDLLQLAWFWIVRSLTPRPPCSRSQQTISHAALHWPPWQVESLVHKNARWRVSIVSMTPLGSRMEHIA
jgi:hypothetical protein